MAINLVSTEILWISRLVAVGRNRAEVASSMRQPVGRPEGEEEQLKSEPLSRLPVAQSNRPISRSVRIQIEVLAL